MEITNLGELFDRFIQSCSASPNRINMTKTAIKHTVAAFGVTSAHEIPVVRFQLAPSTLETYLKNQSKPCSEYKLRNNKSFLQRLIDWGRDQKLFSEETGPDRIVASWEPLVVPPSKGSLQLYRKIVTFKKLAVWAVGQGLTPKDITPHDFLEFFNWLKTNNVYKRYRPAYSLVKRCWMELAEQGKLPHLEFPEIPNKFRSPYLLHLSEWPEIMQADYDKYYHWSTNPIVEDRPQRCKLNPVTAKMYRASLETLAGYFHNILDIPKEDLTFDMFFDKKLITEYFNWLAIERLNGITRTHHHFAVMLYTIGTRHLKRDDLDWLASFRNQFSSTQGKKLLDNLPTIYDLFHIADKIRSDIDRLRSVKGAKAIPVLIRNELIFRFLAYRPLRQRNLREMILDKNLFKDSTGKWQISFQPHETKTGEPIRFPFPEELVPLLEEYLSVARPKLLGNNDYRNVFLTSTRTPMNSGNVYIAITENSLRHLHRRINPHLIRDIVATSILREMPGQYLVVQKLLGHKNITTTLKHYGHFDQQDAANMYDQMLTGKSSESVQPEPENVEILPQEKPKTIKSKIIPTFKRFAAVSYPAQLGLFPST